MRRRFFLATILGGALACTNAPAQDAAGASRPQTPPDRVTVEELKSLLAGERPALVLDVRYGIETKIKSALHVQLDQVGARAAELPRDREIVTYCS